MAAMWALVIKNNSGSDQSIADLGVTILNGSALNISDQYTFDEISCSDDLRGLVSSGALVANDGTNDLDETNGVKHLTLEHLRHLGVNHYTKDELGISGGGGQVHWDNIVGSPSFGSPIWGEPVEYFVTAIDTSAPTTPVTGDVYIDTDTDHYMQWDGSVWVDLGAVDNGDRVINELDQHIYTFDGSSYVDGGESNDNTAVLVNDDGDGKNAQYIYSTEVTDWLKIGDVDFADHFNGGASKHDASEIDVEGTYPNIPGTPSDAEAAFSSINTKLGTIESDINAITLDFAYDGDAGSGAGKNIVVDSGPVTLNATSGTDAPLELSNLVSAPTTNLAAGQLAVVNGIIYIYDNTRAKWLSIQRQTFAFGRRGLTKVQYLPYFGGSLASMTSGLRLMRKAVITGISMQASVAGTGSVNLRSNNGSSNIATLAITSALGNQDTSTNVDLAQGDTLQAIFNSVVGVEDPMVLVEIAWTL